MEKVLGKLAGIFLVVMLPVTSWAAFGNESSTTPEQAAGSQSEKSGLDSKENSHLLFDIREGRIKLELTVLHGVDSGRRSRNNDNGVKTTVEYEVPLVKHLTVGARVMPFFFWNENTQGSNHVFAFGLGPVFRLYHNGKEFRGFFTEIGIMVIGQTNRFEGNSGAFNFLPEGGIGWQFKNGVHVAAKIQHISNASLANKNSGVNGLGIAMGYTFKPRRRH